MKLSEIWNGTREHVVRVRLHSHKPECWFSPFLMKGSKVVVGYDNFGQYSEFFLAEEWELYREPVKMVKYYRISSMWLSSRDLPQENCSSTWYPSKKEALSNWSTGGIKVLEWEERDFPATYEECP